MEGDVHQVQPQIIGVINHIVNRKRPTILARALVRFYNEQRDNDIVSQLREKFGFSITNHSANYHPNHLLNRCNCAHCSKLKEYVDLKISRHRLRRKLYNEHMLDQDIQNILDTISIYDDKIKIAKAIKDELKNKLNI